jgi:predicted nucleic acid-binding protein
MFLLDTNILILGLAGQSPEADVLRKVIEKDSLVFSPIVVAEFLTNASDSEKKVFNLLLSRFALITVDEQVARAAAMYRKKFSEKKKKVFLLDCFLAASCKINKLTLITNNTADFPMKDIKILTPDEF